MYIHSAAILGKARGPAPGMWALRPGARNTAPLWRLCAGMPDTILDCLVIGGGPAGLTAAIYLTRFHLTIRLVDAGDSRAAWIPCTRNHAGYPDGIAGTELLARMREQAQKYGAKIDSGRVTRVEQDADGTFVAEWGSGPVSLLTHLGEP